MPLAELKRKGITKEKTDKIRRFNEEVVSRLSQIQGNVRAIDQTNLV